MPDSPDDIPQAAANPPIEYAQTTYSAILADLERFVADYNCAHAAGPHRMPRIVLDDYRYRSLETDGKLKVWGAWQGANMIALLSYILSSSRHYAPDFLIALHDFFYCEPQHRNGLVPLTLFRRAEAELWEMGAQKIFFVDHVRFLDRSAALKRMGWKPVEVTYEKDRPTPPRVDPPATPSATNPASRPNGNAI